MMNEQKGIALKKTVVLKNLAQYDPELAEDLAMSEEPLEQVIAQELAMWKIIKNERLKNMDLETLLSAFDFFREMMKLCIGMMASINQMYFTQFLQQYEYTANAVAEAIGTHERMPTPKEIIALKVADNIDRLFESIENMQKNLIGGVGNVRREEEKEESATRKTNSRGRGRSKKVN